MTDKDLELRSFKREKIIFVYEFFGTAFLVYFVNMCQGHKFVIPQTLFVMGGLICGPITGGFFNPAVAVGRFMLCPNPRKEAMTLLVYFAAEFLGGLLGFIITYSSVLNIRETLDKPTAVPEGEFIILAPPELISTRGAVMAEFIGSFFLFLVEFVLRT